MLKKQSEDKWQRDPVNPRNWSPAKKWTTTAAVTLYTFVMLFASSTMAHGLPDLATKFNITDPTVTPLTHSIFLFSFTIGPLFAAPLSEVHGRLPVLHLTNILFLLFNLACAFSSFATSTTFLVFWSLDGFVGSVLVTCGGVIVSDLFFERDRASAIALYCRILDRPVSRSATLTQVHTHLARSRGRPRHGMINEPVVFYIVVGICAVTQILGIPLMRESYAPVIRLRRDKNSLDPERVAMVHPAFTINKWAYLWINLKRPVMIMTRSFICFILSLHAGKNGGKGKPEMRVPVVILGSLIVPVGLCWYGWSAQTQTHFMMSIGAAIFGFGIMTASLAIQLYLIDTFTYPASAIAATSMLRALLDFAFPLFGQSCHRYRYTLLCLDILCW
ncbi:major facilitator superfamily domain-containing protein [Suillus subaureus]|uniref:Major facilitator superfamily domain-containing protein n=1 Tax=Suillus subaureus TaxID=48587 RepID=A0A9P7ECV0_9AGAM|nr:major facilitator superfamily domain-containing protein [Suillus subaureus]KAG1817662.1 major facilitator superfamily domain-containing protein [Suillus subaureus]